MNTTTPATTPTPNPMPHLAKEGEASRDETYHRVIPGHSTQRARLLAMVLRAGPRGITINEAAELLEKTPNAISGRFTELKNAGLGYYSRQDTRVDSHGSTSRVFYAVEHLPAADRLAILPPAAQPEAAAEPPKSPGLRTDNQARPLTAGCRYVVTRPGETGAYSIEIREDETGTQFAIGRNINRRIDDLPADCIFARFAQH